MSLRNAYLLIFIILLIDQVSKVYIKTNFVLGEEIVVFRWFRILFIENEGMAWGTVIPGTYGKLFLTIFRIFAVIGIGYWLWDSVKKQSSKYLITAIALILAGAVGNIIDSVFYGIIFSDSHHQLATLFANNLTAPYFTGKWSTCCISHLLKTPCFPRGFLSGAESNLLSLMRFLILPIWRFQQGLGF